MIRHVVIATSALALGGLTTFAVAEQQATATAAQNAPLDLLSLFSYLAISQADRDANPEKADALKRVSLVSLGAGVAAAVALFALVEGVTR